MVGIVLFDGECNLCSGTMQFIIKRDPNGYFRFGSLQSKTGMMLLKKYRLPENQNSVILLDDGMAFEKSAAVLKICSRLTGLWKLVVIFQIIPKPLRDFVYDVIATNRYRWFGKKISCMLPSAENRSRFLDQQPNQPYDPQGKPK
ncbi:thiol-disulfide oxidoreductase DCC family protein [Neobacillus sp. SM06]|uniref:thiol-disulfide oxidoreductase DCC family protein n=1 Tax=Neobacillus sp. SM06 TaxID=3422492 RepID=UPI003D278B30